MPISNPTQQMPKNTIGNSKPQAHDSFMLIYALIFLLSMAVSLCISFALPQFGLAGKFGGTGHDGYLELARSLYSGEGYRFSADGPAAFHRPPLYPLLLAPLMGFSESVVKIGVVTLNSLFLMMACIYTRRICGLLFPQAIVGTVAMALLFCNPWILRLVSSPLSAVMQMALYTTLSFYLLQLCDKFREFNQLPVNQLFHSFLKASLLTTAICYTHGTSVYVCSVLFATLATAMLFNRQWKLVVFLVMTATLTLAALSPWAVRNAQVLDRVELSSSGAGFTYFLGNSYWGIDVGDYLADQSFELNAMRMGGVLKPSENMVEYWGITDPAVDNQLREAMLQHASSHPTELLKKSILNFSDIFFPVTHSAFCAAGNYSIYCAKSVDKYQFATRATRTFFMLIIVALALSYLLSNRIQKTALAWIALTVGLLHVAPYLPIATYAHHGIYTMGTLPILCSLAAAALYGQRIKRALSVQNSNPAQTWHQEPHDQRAQDEPLAPAPVSDKADGPGKSSVKVDFLV